MYMFYVGTIGAVLEVVGRSTVGLVRVGGGTEIIRGRTAPPGPSQEMEEDN